MSSINYQIFEIRYKENAKVLDYRGAWTEAISKVLDLQEWRIDQNRIDVFDADQKHQAFVSFTNSGFSSRFSPTKSYFADNAIKFLRVLFQLNGFETSPLIRRLGVRSRFCNPFSGEFSQLVELYASNFIGPTAAAKLAIDSNVLDIGSPLTLKDKIGNINFVGGPMEEGQLRQFFGIQSDSEDLEVPDVSLVFDIDYWDTPNINMTEEDISRKVRAFADACWNMNDRIVTLITGK